MLLKCKEENIQYVVMEASSQGLDMHRLDGLHFKYAIFTNLTQDHLDYHKTMNNYLKAKLKLFNISDIGIVNIDDSYSKYFIDEKV